MATGSEAGHGVSELDAPPRRLSGVLVGGLSDAWTSIGFSVDPTGRVPFVNGALEIDAEHVARPIGLRVAFPLGAGASLEGIPLKIGDVLPAGVHPNGCFELDHIVILTDDLERSSAVVGRVLGLERRRLRETAAVRQAFHRFEPRGCIIELVENQRVRATTLYGLVVNTPDLERTCAELGPDLIGAPKPAVQPGRLIATVREAAGLGFPVALMTPAP
jgi:catechol 2,3-dioxygenase-like lactoylglutathione lyase family enzyme